jgi:pyridoxamine 5'-phosphate oxidase
MSEILPSARLRARSNFDSTRSLAYVFALMNALDLATLRREYDTAGLRRADLHHDPIEQFATWFSTALNSGLPDANAISLATATHDGKPSARVVLLKGFDQRGFVFYTNYQSDKGRELEANPEAAFVIYWVQLERQIRVAGRVERTSRAESEAYFLSRPRGSQLSAWVSHQSEVIDARRILEARLAEMTERFASAPMELPPHWGGYRIVPETVEFWQGRANRLHDRFRYTREGDDSWRIDRLAP